MTNSFKPTTLQPLLDIWGNRFYPKPMIQRYSRPAMREIWSEQRKLELWLQIELLASEALCAAGVGVTLNRVSGANSVSTS